MLKCSLISDKKAASKNIPVLSSISKVTIDEKKKQVFCGYHSEKANREFLQFFMKGANFKVRKYVPIDMFLFWPIYFVLNVVSGEKICLYK